MRIDDPEVSIAPSADAPPHVGRPAVSRSTLNADKDVRDPSCHIPRQTEGHSDQVVRCSAAATPTDARQVFDLPESLITNSFKVCDHFCGRSQTQNVGRGVSASQRLAAHQSVKAAKQDNRPILLGSEIAQTFLKFVSHSRPYSGNEIQTATRKDHDRRPHRRTRRQQRVFAQLLKAAGHQPERQTYSHR